MFLMCFTICIWGGGVMMPEMSVHARERERERERSYIRKREEDEKKKKGKLEKGVRRRGRCVEIFITEKIEWRVSFEFCSHYRETLHLH